MIHTKPWELLTVILIVTVFLVIYVSIQRNELREQLHIYQHTVNTKIKWAKKIKHSMLDVIQTNKIIQKSCKSNTSSLYQIAIKGLNSRYRLKIAAIGVESIFGEKIQQQINQFIPLHKSIKKICSSRITMNKTLLKRQHNIEQSMSASIQKELAKIQMLQNKLEHYF